MIEQRFAFHGPGPDALVPGEHHESGGSDERQPRGVSSAGGNEAVRRAGPGDVAADVLKGERDAETVLVEKPARTGCCGHVWVSGSGLLSGRSLVVDGGVDLVDVDAVHGRHVLGRFAGGDEFGDGLGADASRQGGFAEAALGIEDDRDGAAQGIEPLRVTVAVVGEVEPSPRTPGRGRRVARCRRGRG